MTANELRRCAYRITDEARRVEALIGTTPADDGAWEDIRWAHAVLGALLRLGPDRADDAGPILDPVDREALEPPRLVSNRDSYGARRARLEAAGWQLLEYRSSNRWVPPGSDGRMADRRSLRQALAQLDAELDLNTGHAPGREAAA